MTISIITINRNNADGLARTLQSVALQLQHLPASVSLQHIIVDGMSSDNSLQTVIPELRSHVISLPPAGVYNAINAGIKAASGDIIGLLHSGDVYEQPDSLATIITQFSSQHNLDYVWGDIRIGRRLYPGNNFSLDALAHGQAPPHPTLYMRRHVHDVIGLYDESYSVAADFEYFIRLALNTDLKGLYIPEVIVRMEPGGLSQSLHNRLVVNNSEKLKALRSHGISSNYFNIFSHYKNVLKGFLCSSTKK